MICSRVGARRRTRALRLGDPGGRDQLHRLGDLLGGLRRADPPPQDANLCRHDARPQSCLADLDRLLLDLVLVHRLDLAPRATSDSPVGRREAVLEVLDRRRSSRLDVLVGQLAGVADRPRARPRALRRRYSQELALEPLDVGHRHVVELAAGAEPRSRRPAPRPGYGEYCGCLSSSTRRAPRSSAAADAASRSEPNAANASSSRYWARSSRSEPETFFMALTCAAPPTRDTEMPTLMAGRTPWLNRSDSRKTLAVGDRDDVGRDVGRDVVGLRLDDRQAGHRAGAQLVGQLRAALQQPGVQVEDVARVGLAARRAAQQQRDRPVGLGLLGQVVEDDQDVLALRTSSAGRWPSRCRGRAT